MPLLQNINLPPSLSLGIPEVPHTHPHSLNCLREWVLAPAHITSVKSEQVRLVMGASPCLYIKGVLQPP